MSREDHHYRNHRFTLLIKLLAIVCFIAGGITCSIIHEQNLAMLLLGASSTAFSTLFVGSPSNPFPPNGPSSPDNNGGDNNNDNGGGGNRRRIPGSGVVERTKPTVIKGAPMEFVIIVLLFIIGLTLTRMSHP